MENVFGVEFMCDVITSISWFDSLLDFTLGCHEVMRIISQRNARLEKDN